MRFTVLRSAIRERALRTWTDRASPALSRIAYQEWRKILNRTRGVGCKHELSATWPQVIETTC